MSHHIRLLFMKWLSRLKAKLRRRSRRTGTGAVVAPGRDAPEVHPGKRNLKQHYTSHWDWDWDWDYLSREELDALARERQERKNAEDNRD